jgi:hypothetical protein
MAFETIYHVYKLMRLKFEGLHAICLPCTFINPLRVMLFKLICIYYNIIYPLDYTSCMNY